LGNAPREVTTPFSSYFGAIRNSLTPCRFGEGPTFPDAQERRQPEDQAHSAKWRNRFTSEACAAGQANGDYRTFQAATEAAFPRREIVKVQITSLRLVYPPISNQVADWMKSDPEVEAVLRKSNLYMVAQREEAKFTAVRWRDADLHLLVACRRVTITRLLASKLSWPLAVKSYSPNNSSPI